MKNTEVHISFKTLQPGFLVIYVPRGYLGGGHVTIPDWKEMKANGWSGGIILPHETLLMSLSDEELKQQGLMRIPKEKT